MQDLDGFSFHGIDHDVRKRSKRQFPCPISVAGPASVGCALQEANLLVDCPHSRLCKVRVVLLEIDLDVLKIIGGRKGPTNAHQALNMASRHASISSSSIKIAALGSRYSFFHSGKEAGFFAEITG